MIIGNGKQTAALERWSPAGFVGGGVIALLGFFAVLVWGEVGVLLSLAGVLVALVPGLVGLYPAVAESTPGTALVGLAGVAVAGVALSADLVWTIGSTLAGTPLTEADPDWEQAALRVAFLSAGVSFLVYGAESLRTRVFPREAGALAVAAALSLPVSFGLESLFGEAPTWLLWTTYFAFAAALLGLGFVLGVENALAEYESPFAGVSTGESGASGWTNEHVRDGFDVDGAESRTLPVSMGWRLHLKKVEYEVLGAVSTYRVLYPPLRSLGRLLNRERGTEQYIAEREYVLSAVRATDHGGIGSFHWRLGVGLFAGMGVIGGGIGFTAGTVLFGDVELVGTGGAVTAGGVAVLFYVGRALRRAADRDRRGGPPQQSRVEAVDS